MKEQIQLDPSSPYYRECPFCNEPFMASHLLQKFCPEKYDKPNYCKDRYKTLKRQSKESVPEAVVHKEPPKQSPPPEIQSRVVVEPAEVPAIVLEPVTPSEVIPVEEASPVPVANAPTENEMIINKLMGNSKERDFTFKEIASYRVDLRNYDAKRPLPYYNVTFLEIGNYGVLWTSINSIKITHLSELLWVN